MDWIVVLFVDTFHIVLVISRISKIAREIALKMAAVFLFFLDERLFKIILDHKVFIKILFCQFL